MNHFNRINHEMFKGGSGDFPEKIEGEAGVMLALAAYYKFWTNAPNEIKKIIILKKTAAELHSVYCVAKQKSMRGVIQIIESKSKDQSKADALHNAILGTMPKVVFDAELHCEAYVCLNEILGLPKYNGLQAITDEIGIWLQKGGY